MHAYVHLCACMHDVHTYTCMHTHTGEELGTQDSQRTRCAGAAGWEAEEGEGAPGQHLGESNPPRAAVLRGVGAQPGSPEQPAGEGGAEAPRWAQSFPRHGQVLTAPRLLPARPRPLEVPELHGTLASLLGDTL